MVIQAAHTSPYPNQQGIDDERGGKDVPLGKKRTEQQVAHPGEVIGTLHQPQIVYQFIKADRLGKQEGIRDKRIN